MKTLWVLMMLVVGTVMADINNPPVIDASWQSNKYSQANGEVVSNLAASAKSDAGVVSGRVDVVTGDLTTASNLAASAKSTADLALPQAGGSMSGVLDMGGNSITNIGTNSIAFMDGTKISSSPNGVLKVGSGTNLNTVVTDGNIQTYAPTPPVYLADGITTKKSGTTFSVANWIPNNLTDLYTQFLVQQGATSRGLLDGPGYLFNDENGILPALSTNQVFETRWYKNKVDSTNTGASYPSIYMEGAKIETTPDTRILESSSGTITFWMKQSTRALSYVVCAGSPSGGGYTRFGLTPHDPVNNVDFIIWNGPSAVGYEPDSPLPDTPVDWHFYAITHTDGITSVFIDMVHCTEESATYPWFNSQTASQLFLGHDEDGNDGDRLTGNLYQVAVWADVALSSNQLADVYSSGSLSSVTNGLISVWCTSEMSGTNVYDTFGTNTGFAYGVVSNSVDAPTIAGSFEYTTNSMSLTCTNKVLDFLPTSTWMSILAQGTGLTTDDLQGYVSPDYGTNWHQASLVPQASVDLSNTLFQGVASYTNNVDSSNMVLKAVTTSNKVVKVLGMWGPSN